MSLNCGQSKGCWLEALLRNGYDFRAGQSLLKTVLFEPDYCWENSRHGRMHWPAFHKLLGVLFSWQNANRKERIFQVCCESVIAVSPAWLSKLHHCILQGKIHKPAKFCENWTIQSLKWPSPKWYNLQKLNFLPQMLLHFWKMKYVWNIFSR